MYARQPGRFTLPGIGGPGGRIPGDLLVLLGVVFLTFALQFFPATAPVHLLLSLTPWVWQRGYVWQLATYPFTGAGSPGLGFLLALLMLYWFGRDVYAGLRRRLFWRLIAWSSIGAGIMATAVDALGGGSALGGPQPFVLMQGQWILLTIFIAAFATANRDAVIYFMFILPIQARWFLGLEILLAFMGFLGTHDLPGFVGICAAVGLTYVYIAYGTGRTGLREMRLRLQRWWLQRRLARTRRKSGLRVIPGQRDNPRGPRIH
jgi:hypothetical protein